MLIVQPAMGRANPERRAMNAVVAAKAPYRTPARYFISVLALPSCGRHGAHAAPSAFCLRSGDCPSAVHQGNADCMRPRGVAIGLPRLQSHIAYSRYRLGKTKAGPGSGNSSRCTPRHSHGAVNGWAPVALYVHERHVSRLSWNRPR